MLTKAHVTGGQWHYWKHACFALLVVVPKGKEVYKEYDVVGAGS